MAWLIGYVIGLTVTGLGLGWIKGGIDRLKEHDVVGLLLWPLSLVGMFAMLTVHVGDLVHKWLSHQED